MAFQRKGQSTDEVLKTTKLSKDSRRKLEVPPILNEIDHSAQPPINPEPVFPAKVDLNWYDASCTDNFKTSKSTFARDSMLEDTAFAIARAENDVKIGWSEFHRRKSKRKLEKSAIGYLPIINNPAHEFSSLRIVLERAIAIADSLGKKYAVITTDQALYCKLLELVWSSPVFRERIKLRMGGLHIAMNFLKVIGKHMSGTGLKEIWRESGFMAEGSITKVLDGKAYSKGMRAHKLTFQAFWRIVTPQFKSFLEEEKSSSVEIKNWDDFSQLQSILKADSGLECLDNFIEKKCKNSSNFALWWSYIHMVCILLMLTKSIRDGLWETYVAALSEMLPYMARYDHGNYFKSLSVYVADMHQLPEEIEKAFQSGDFGVLLSEKEFSQVDPDHAQEWVVGVCKDAGGLVGITQNEAALQKWALSYHWRSELTKKTFAMYGIKSRMFCNEETKARRKRDTDDEDILLKSMTSFNLLSDGTNVCNIATKDQATPEIADALLKAKGLGQLQVNEFVSQRLLRKDSETPPSISFYDPVPKNNALTLADLYKIKPTKDTQKVLQADRSILQRLVVAYEAGRKIDLKSILKHELLPVPLSLAEMNGCLRSPDKSVLIKLLTEKLECPVSLALEKVSSTLIIDGQALVMSLGKPPGLENFGDLAELYTNNIQKYAKYYSRIDIVFDRYREKSIKSGTRTKRSKGATPIRRIIENASVPLPKDWKNFISSSENKENLISFLSEQILVNDFGGTDIVVAGGFKDERLVKSNNPSLNVDMLSATHEEADTRIILHAFHSSSSHIVVKARDTDICVLLIHHFPKMDTSKIWMMSGTAKSRKFIPIHEICKNLSELQMRNILSFHAITGSDTTSQLATITKRTAWKSFLKKSFCSLLNDFGNIPLAASVAKNVEKYVIQLYKVQLNFSTYLFLFYFSIRISPYRSVIKL